MMASSFQLRAVFEFSGFNTQSTFPWAVTEVKKTSWNRLSAEMTHPEIGLVFAELARYNNLDFSGDCEAILSQMITAESLILAGGLLVIVDGEAVIGPSCCCGLEGMAGLPEDR
jgi:hypothetical protein